jgi:hypothetical protein
MTKGKAFVVVGHSNWGKSETLRVLTDGSYKMQHCIINDIFIKVKKMSNDDIPISLIKFLKTADPKTWPYIIVALCPDFNDDSKMTRELLELIQQKYDIYFWILKHAYSDARVIEDTEISILSAYGSICIYERQEEAKHRAKDLEKYIITNIE